MSVRAGWICLMVAVSVCTSMAEGQPMDKDEAQIIKARMIPYPQNVLITDGPVVVMDKRLAVKVTLKDELGTLDKQIRELYKSYFGVKPNLTVKRDTSINISKDGYQFNCSKQSGLSIEASDVNGVLNALKTLRQLAEPERGLEKLRYYFLPEISVEDAPAMGFRGMHICWFPENDEVFMEKCIRMAAYYKFNFVVLELWAIFDYKSHPEFSWAEKKIKTKTIHRLVRLARSQGLTLIPQFNLFGHAPASRNVSGKHPVLDFHPEMQPLFEPDGWTWCLSNPATRRYLTEMTMELYEAFESPPYFHIGCDEAYSMSTCLTCRKADYAALLKDHLLHFHKLFGERGAKIMMWHDMLVVKGDPRWKGYVAMGSEKIGTEALLDALPRDIVICDWQYYTVPAKDAIQWPTMQYFHEKGFPVLACPWKNSEGTKSQSSLVLEKGMAGMLCTTWNYMHGNDMYRMLYYGAHATWGYGGTGWNPRTAFNMHLRQIGWEMPIKHYRDTGVAQWQVPPENALLH
ncbi:MAG: family 20 glycosylhydrolase [Kiritimatiellia bacterium]